MQENWLNNALQKLHYGGYRVTTNVNYQGKTFQAVAHKSGFEITKFGNYEVFFVFVEIPNLDYQTLMQYSNFAYNFAIATKSVGLPCGLFEAVTCYPVAVTDNIDAATAQAVSSAEPTKHWGSFEFPVIYSRNHRMLYYYQNTPLWGAAYMNGFRKTLLQFLPPN